MAYKSYSMTDSQGHIWMVGASDEGVWVADPGGAGFELPMQIAEELITFMEYAMYDKRKVDAEAISSIGQVDLQSSIVPSFDLGSIKIGGTDLDPFLTDDNMPPSSDSFPVDEDVATFAKAFPNVKIIVGSSVPCDCAACFHISQTLGRQDISKFYKDDMIAAIKTVAEGTKLVAVVRRHLIADHPKLGKSNHVEIAYVADRALKGVAAHPMIEEAAKTMIKKWEDAGRAW